MRRGEPKDEMSYLNPSESYNNVTLMFPAPFASSPTIKELSFSSVIICHLFDKRSGVVSVQFALNPDARTSEIAKGLSCAGTCSGASKGTTLQKTDSDSPSTKKREKIKARNQEHEMTLDKLKKTHMEKVKELERIYLKEVLTAENLNKRKVKEIEAEFASTESPQTPQAKIPPVCTLCYIDNINCRLLPCQHKLCSECAVKVIKCSLTCPWCRNEVTGKADFDPLELVTMETPPSLPSNSSPIGPTSPHIISPTPEPLAAHTAPSPSSITFAPSPNMCPSASSKKDTSESIGGTLTMSSGSIKESSVESSEGFGERMPSWASNNTDGAFRISLSPPLEGHTPQHFAPRVEPIVTNITRRKPLKREADKAPQDDGKMRRIGSVEVPSLSDDNLSWADSWANSIESLHDS